MVSKKLFFSYGRDPHNPQYVDIVHKVKQYLEAQNFEVFMDVEQLKGGDDWEKKLESEIRQSDIFLYFVTSYATRPDGYCRNELSFALSLKKKIIPLMISYEPLPLSICRLQYIDLQNINSDKHLVSKIEQIIPILDDILFQSPGEKIQSPALIDNIASTKQNTLIVDCSNDQTHLNQYDFPYKKTKEYVQVSGVALLMNNRFVFHSHRMSQLCNSTGEVLANLGNVKGALSINDNKILTYSMNETIKLWTLEGQNLAQFVCNFKIKKIHIIDNDKFISRSSDNILRICNFFGKILHKINVDKGLNGLVILSHDRILLYFSNGTLQMIDLQGRLIRNLYGHSEGINGVCLLSNDRILSYSNDRTLRIWDREGRTLAVLKGHKNPINGAKVMKDGRILSYSGSTIYMWNTAGELMFVTKAHKGPINRVQIFEDGRILTCGSDGTLRLWNQKCEAVSSLKVQLGAFRNIYLLDKNNILIYSLNNTLSLWSSKE